LTTPPLPDSPCVRVKLDYTQTDGFLAGSRFFLGYGGSAPTAGNCSTLATDIASLWSSHLASWVSEEWSLTEVDVLDIASLSGSSGQWTGSDAGSSSGTGLPAQSATNVEFDIARRYRGGKPRMYLPCPSNGYQLDPAHYTSAFVTAVSGAFETFFTDIEALSIGAMGALQHVNVSYYSGFTNVTNSSGRTRAAPKYRASALVEPVNGYACKAVIGSQRKRRLAVSA